MQHSIRLRRWQKAALEALAAAPGPDFLAVATPGAGKTTFALTAARHDLARSGPRRIVVVTPTQHLKHQWARAALAFGLHLEPAWRAVDGALPADVHGVAVTYQQVATSAGSLRSLASGAFVVFDEIHHAADDRAWGDAIRLAFEPAARRLSLSGTPFRSDTSAIPFIRYELDEARPDFEYGYADALADGGVVRPVYFPRVDGLMEWWGADGSLHSHTFADALDPVRAGQRLRTALSLDGEWLPAVLRQAHEQLLDIRCSQHDAGGLVVAVDQDHARGIADLLRHRLSVRAVVATSDDPAASARIAEFADGAAPWIVAVRMVSEGVDIPRLRVGVFATNATTELFFRQAVGRLVRWRRHERRQRAFLYLPDDARLRAHAFQIADQRRHSLRRTEREMVPVPQERVQRPAEDEQLSMFAPISAVALATAAPPEWALDDDVPAGEPDEDALTVVLPPLPGSSGADQPGDRRSHRQRLREQNADQARAIARRANLGHPQVNAELNRLAGVRRITEATVEQLEVRLRHAERWLQRI